MDPSCSSSLSMRLSVIRSEPLTPIARARSRLGALGVPARTWRAWALSIAGALEALGFLATKCPPQPASQFEFTRRPVRLLACQFSSFSRPRKVFQSPQALLPSLSFSLALPLPLARREAQALVRG